MMSAPVIGIIGYAGRFPGASDAAAFWQNLAAGVESIRFLSDTDLRQAGVEASLVRDPNYVKAAPLLDGVEMFDAALFGVAPSQARALDPQHRLFLECAWEALEHGGYDARRYRGRIGVYAGAALNTYMLRRDLPTVVSDDYLAMLVDCDKDFLATRVSYALGLTGPSVAVQTACSTSLVAVHLACQALVAGECDMALAGAVAVRFPHVAGHLCGTRGLLSRDGHCRSFDAGATGTIFGSGAGVVLLKMLEDARDDSVHAVIRGWAVNNDGAGKADYMSPSVHGQEAVIAEALEHAGVDAGTISYVEAHGSATSLGDPLEVTALTGAFRRTTQATGFCAIGSVKTNIGHLDAAAGMAGLIKTVLALGHGQIPPSLHYRTPNPEIDFAHSPFYVNTRLAPWPAIGAPRRAGVSAFGIGGTNAHLVLEESPQAGPRPASVRGCVLIPISARSIRALDEATAALAAHWSQHPVIPTDLAYTLQVGRMAFEYRRTVVCSGRSDGVMLLERQDPVRVVTARATRDRRVVFMFPGSGSHSRHMGADVYAAEPSFKADIDAAVAMLPTDLAEPVRRFWRRDGPALADAELDRPSVQMPGIFIFEHALARLLVSWGVRPAAMIGHSLGEITAACVAGVFTPEDALRLVVARARVLETVAGGVMVSASLPVSDVEALLEGSVDVAAENGPCSSVVSGTLQDVEVIERRLQDRGVETQRLRMPTAAHSRMLDPLLDEFRCQIAGMRLSAPAVPFVSSLTGTWITAEQAVDVEYWVQQLRRRVRFAGGAAVLLRETELAFIEVGPGHTLGALMRSQPRRSASHVFVETQPHSTDPRSGEALLLHALGTLWTSGVEVDWEAFAHVDAPRRVPLPTIRFDRQRYWLDEERRGRGSRGIGRVRGLGTALFRRGRQAFTRRTPWRRLLTPTVTDHDRARVENEIVTLWKEVLGLDALDRNDDFFALGGRSLQTMQMLQRINTRFDSDVSVVDFLSRPTVSGLARVIIAIASTNRSGSGLSTVERI